MLVGRVSTPAASLSRTRSLTSALALLVLSLAVSSCGRVTSAYSAQDFSGRTIRALATVGMVGDVVRNVGGERVTVETLMGPGVDPHLYKPSESDVLDIAEADAVFYAGLHLEGRMTEVLERTSDTRPVVAVTEDTDHSRLLRSAAFEGSYDPHVWMDVSLWATTVDRVERALIEMDPGSAAVYRARATAYRQELAALHEYVRRQVATIPPRSRVLVTAHDAFSYYGRAYGMEVRGLQGISTETEAGVGDVQQLASMLVERRIKAVFIESSVPRRNIEAVQAAARARGQEVAIGGELFSDAMGKAGTPEGTYIGMIRHNTDTIVRALR